MATRPTKPGFLRGLSLLSMGSARSTRSSNASQESGVSSEHSWHNDDDESVDSDVNVDADSANISASKEAAIEMPFVSFRPRQAKLKSILKQPDEHGVTRALSNSDLSYVSDLSRHNSRRHLGLGGDSSHSHSSSVAGRPNLRRVHHHVGFGSVEVREYNRTIGDNPSVSSGPPMSLDWTYDPNETRRYDINSYEAMQIPLRRNEQELALPRQIREELLLYEWDVPQSVLAAAVLEVVRCKNQRRQTVHKLTSGWSKVDKLVQRTTSKVQRKLKKKKSTKASSSTSTLSTVPLAATMGDDDTEIDETTLEAQRLAEQHLLLQKRQLEQQQKEEAAIVAAASTTASTVDDSSSQVSSVRDTNPLDESFDYGSYYTAVTAAATAKQASKPTKAKEALLSTEEQKVVDDARLAELAAKLWQSAAVSKSKFIEDVDVKVANDCQKNEPVDDYYTDPEGYHQRHHLPQPIRIIQY